RRTGSPTLEGRVAEALTINETSFFRDPTPFDAVREDVLPRLVQENAARREIRIWCGASSTGQEPYSLAILIREKFPQLATWNVRILATDIADSMLARTAAGTYSSLEMNRGMPASLCIRHFDRVGTAWRVKRHLRAMIEVQKLNLVGAWPPLGRFDLVLLRNVLIYFDPTTKEAVLNRVAAAMNPGGALLLGCTESVLGLKTPFRPEPNARSTVYRLA
ncbi:MAG: protein-glutamate O-methyltransferase CheR, partial [Planctomycetota bacterium]